MKRFLCFSLCLGLMVSACKKKSLEESVNKAIAKAGAGGAGAGSGGGDGGGGDDGATTVTKNNKEAVLKACLPKINAEIVKEWGNVGAENLFLRRNRDWKTTPADPLVVLYTGQGLPLAFEPNAGFGLGKDKATVTKNLNEMAASKVIQDQFVARANNASGWRVHISKSNTDVAIPASEENAAPVAPANSGIIIYDRENVVDEAGVRIPQVDARSFRQAGERAYMGGWFDCEVNDTTQDVTLKFDWALFSEPKD